MYEIEIECWNGELGGMAWRKIHQTGKPPYRFETEEEARRMLNMCYPDMMSEHKRVVQVK